MTPEQPPVLIVGGYGVVGAQVAHILRQRHPALPLAIAGRSLAAAQAAAAELPGAIGVRLDLAEPNPLQALPFVPSAILAAANDPGDHLLLAAVAAGAPYVDITRWTERLRTALLRLSASRPQAPVIFASAWMAGVAATVAAAAARELARIDALDIDVLYALRDRAGPDSFEYADRLATPFPVWRDGVQRLVRPMTDARRVTFARGAPTRTWRFDTPDQLTLPLTLGAREAAARITYDDPVIVAVMRVLLRSGLWTLISGPAFAGLRRAVLFHPGEGDQHEFQISIQGSDMAGVARSRVVSVIDPQGQTHMTAIGAVCQIERLLGLAGRAKPRPGVGFPEQTEDLTAAVRALVEMGVEVRGF